MNKPRVCIVGAGASGLCACKHLLKRGIRPTVFELSTSEIGGVWRSNSISITRLQTPRVAYQFSDLPWPNEAPSHPSASQVLDYLQEYASRFGVLECVKFGSRVLQLSRKQTTWEVLVQHGTDQEEVLEFEYIILCIGRFGDVPNVPSFPAKEGPEVFKGKVMHSIEYSSLSAEDSRNLLNGSRVVVVGFSKSAIDIATEAVLANQGAGGKPCTLLFRRAQWMVTDWFGMQLGRFYATRLSEMAIQKPGQGRVSAVFSTLLWPLKWIVCKSVEVYLQMTLPLKKYGLVPDIPFDQGMASCRTSNIPDNFFNYIESGWINLCKSGRWHFVTNGILLENGNVVEADVVVLATGFKGEIKLKSILPKEYGDVLQGPDGVVPLYRGIIPPRIPSMGILGYQEDLSNIRASEMGARWLAYLLDDQFKLPSVEEMERSANSWVEYMKRASPYYGRACVTAIRTWHSDELCRDIGWSPRRKSSWLQELFSPYSNMDYVDP